MTTTLAAGASTNLITDHYLGKLVVLDDYPSPTITVHRVHRRVAEGASAQWSVTLSRPVGDDLLVYGNVVHGPGRDLTGADAPRSWSARHASGDVPTHTLAALGAEARPACRPARAGS